MEDIKYYYEMEQGTEEWLIIKLGLNTSSIINDLVTPTGKIATGKKIDDIAFKMAAQRETKLLEDNYQSFDMMRGHIQEEIARDIYSENIESVKECGIIIRDFGSFKIGASPDGLVGDNGGIEIKSRLSKFQVKTIIKNEVPVEYINQIQTALLVSSREWWDFIQYSNGMPLFIQRIYPDNERQELIKEACENLEKLIAKYQKQYKENSKNLIKTEWVNLNISDDIILGAEND
jgi:hypothetical protein